MPYIARGLPAAGGAPRMIAILRLRHAPYDTLGLIAERVEAGWKLTDVVGAADM